MKIIQPLKKKTCTRIQDFEVGTPVQLIGWTGSNYREDDIFVTGHIPTCYIEQGQGYMNKKPIMNLRTGIISLTAKTRECIAVEAEVKIL